MNPDQDGKHREKEPQALVVVLDKGQNTDHKGQQPHGLRQWVGRE